MDISGVDVAVLYVQYLEGRMVDPTNIEERLAALPKPGCPEVGEDGAPTTSLLFRSGRTSIIPSTSNTLYQMGLIPYPRLHLTTQHALLMTRALATLHANSTEGAETAAARATDPNAETDNNSDANNEGESKEDLYMYSKCPASVIKGGMECAMGKVEECNGECGDMLTSEITQVEIAKANLTILTETLRSHNQSPLVIRQLVSLETDLPTLMDFIQFSSAVSKKWVASVGPISCCDVWVTEDETEDVIVIRLRGGTSLRAPPLRDAAWTWLTLIDPTTLRERYSELCDEYCSAYNTACHRLSPDPGPVQEILSYFDVMRDLGESFLHAFFTLLHKFVVSGTWFLDRELYEPAGIARLVALIEFLIENGIVGNIFIA